MRIQTLRAFALARDHGLTEMNFDPEQALRYVAGSVGQVTAAVSSVLGGITALSMIFVLGIFFAIEPRLYERGIAWLLPLSERQHFYEMSAEMGSTLRRLMAGRLPMAALLGIITGLLVFIPNIGAILSGVLMVLVGFSMGTDGGLYAMAVYAVVQTVDGYVIVPMVARRTVDLAPALVLGAQLLFGALFGIMGLALADPIVAMLKVALEKNAQRSANLAKNIAATEPAAPPAKPRSPAKPRRRAAS